MHKFLFFMFFFFFSFPLGAPCFSVFLSSFLCVCACKLLWFHLVLQVWIHGSETKTVCWEFYGSTSKMQMINLFTSRRGNSVIKTSTYFIQNKWLTLWINFSQHIHSILMTPAGWIKPTNIRWKRFWMSTKRNERNKENVKIINQNKSYHTVEEASLDRFADLSTFKGALSQLLLKKLQNNISNYHLKKELQIYTAGAVQAHQWRQKFLC